MIKKKNVVYVIDDDESVRRAARKIGIPVIVVSAYDDEPTRQLARELGAVAFFRKPVDGQALLDAIWFAIWGG
ncbi:MAG TPA: hypothetical protein VKF36_16295 [Syntrophorhabdales bacterium]|nr:hypothetical protein [Syntrophorhabdales bacterium]